MVETVTLIATDLTDLNNLLPGFVLVEPSIASQAPRCKGSYALLIRLDETIQVFYAGKADSLDPGWYVYCGSANGPGGIRARLCRHFRHTKRHHWHVDQLTEKAAQLWAFAQEGGNECAIAETLTQSGRFESALEGFGSSDCIRCEAHLLHWKG